MEWKQEILEAKTSFIPKELKQPRRKEVRLGPLLRQMYQILVKEHRIRGENHLKLPSNWRPNHNWTKPVKLSPILPLFDDLVQSNQSRSADSSKNWTESNQFTPLIYCNKQCSHCTDHDTVYSVQYEDKTKSAHTSKWENADAITNLLTL